MKLVDYTTLKNEVLKSDYGLKFKTNYLHQWQFRGNVCYFNLNIEKQDTETSFRKQNFL